MKPDRTRRESVFPGPDLKAAIFYTPEEVARIFRREGDPRKAVRWVYRHAEEGGFLAPCARRFGRTILFSREGIDRLTEGENNTGHS